jgi:hypothetical protein
VTTAAIDINPVTLRRMIFHSLYQWLGIVCLAVAAAPAIWRGGWPERTAAIAMVAAWLGSGLVQNGMQLWGLQIGVMLIDLVLLAVLLAIALRSDRWWPMWASAFHGLGALLHFAVLVDAKVWGRTYFIAGSLFSFLTLAALLVGGINRMRRPLAD